jgi:hypothetical protein
MNISLKTGTLKIKESTELNRLLSFSSRINKKRGFFFVSKVLGKHIPTTPSIMESTYKELANLIPKSEEKTLFVGFAEAATALGQGVFEALNQDNSFYMHSSRFKTSHEVLLSFQEEHSHAPSHIFYAPQDKSLQELLENITRIVLIDDEVTTGNTANNLIEEFKKILPKVKTYTLITILDWSSKKYDNFDIYSLYKGHFSFEKNTKDFSNTIKSEAKDIPSLEKVIPYNFARYGTKKLNIDVKKYIKLEDFRNKKVLVLGTAEFMYAPYLLAKVLEDAGVETYFQATTRSPINIDGAITSKIEFKDNYFENIDNFLYNVIDRDYDKVIVCYETKSLPKNFDLKAKLEKKFDTQEIFFEF